MQTLLARPFFIFMKPVYSKTAVLYSFEQKAFHIETLSDYCRSNIEASKRNIAHQYRLIGIADDDQEADEMIKQLHLKFNW